MVGSLAWWSEHGQGQGGAHRDGPCGEGRRPQWEAADVQGSKCCESGARLLIVGKGSQENRTGENEKGPCDVGLSTEEQADRYICLKINTFC